MKKASMVLPLLLATAWMAAAQAPAGWVKFSPSENYFSILMPTEPTPESKKMNDPRAGDYTTNLFTARGAGEIYMIGWVDYPATFNFDVQKELEANRDNFIKGVNAKLLNSTAIKLGTHRGLEFTAELATQPVQVKSRVYVVGRRPYQLIALTSKDKDASQNFERFFSSFELK